MRRKEKNNNKRNRKKLHVPFNFNFPRNLSRSCLIRKLDLGLPGFVRETLLDKKQLLLVNLVKLPVHDAPIYSYNIVINNIYFARSEFLHIAIFI